MGNHSHLLSRPVVAPFPPFGDGAARLSGPVVVPFPPFGDGAARLSGPVVAPFPPFGDGAARLSGPVVAPFPPFGDGAYSTAPCTTSQSAHRDHLSPTRLLEHGPRAKNRSVAAISRVGKSRRTTEAAIVDWSFFVCL
jgi:hypothetical protein